MVIYIYMKDHKQWHKQSLLSVLLNQRAPYSIAKFLNIDSFVFTLEDSFLTSDFWVCLFDYDIFERSLFVGFLENLVS